MGNYISSVPPYVTILGTNIPTGFIMVGGLLAGFIIIGCLCVKCTKAKRPTVGESFKWPNSSRFLKRVDPAHPPPLVVEKYVNPVRNDQLPEDEETFWIVKYQPNGERDEVKHFMYLRFSSTAGAVYGIGYEEARKLCKISGKYRLNKRAKQTAITLECKFSNECDTVLFHGCGNGTGILGNCYVREINPFSMLAGFPGVRRMSSDKYKGSFLMLKQSGMGDPSLRSRLHTRRVHKWARECYPDNSEPMPVSPLHSPGRASSGGRGYAPVDALGNNSSGLASELASPLPSSRKQSGRRGNAGGVGKKIRRIFHRRKLSAEVGQSRPTGGSTRADGAGTIPPWVKPGGGADSGDDDDHARVPASARRTRRPSEVCV